MIQINSNGSKWYGQEPDPIEVLFQVLENNTLDPTFEKYGDFVNRNPHWLKKEAAEKYKGCTVISGNFATLSHVFNIITDDEELIRNFEVLVNNNKQRPEYQEIKKDILEKEERKANAQKLFNEGKITLRQLYNMAI